MRFVLGFLWIGGAAWAQSVEGTITNSLTGAPIVGAEVQIAGLRHAAYQTNTDGRGSFRFEKVDEGDYFVVVTQSGFQFGPSANRLLRATAGPDPARFDAKLIPLATVSGKVVDGSDQPVPGAEVELFQGSLPKHPGRTDAEGSYSLANIPSGSYVLRAIPTDGLKPPAAIDGERLGWIRTWYPDSTDQKTAAKIVVQAGVALAGINVKLRAVPVHLLRGTVVDLSGAPAAQIPVTFEDGTGKESLSAVSSADGSFEIRDLHDGDWRLTAEKSETATKLRASTMVTVAGKDVDRVELRLAAPFQVPIHVTAPPSLKIPAAVVFMPEEGGAAIPQGHTDVDGNGVIEGVYPGRYQIRTFPLQVGVYLDSVRLGDREVRGQSVELSPGSVAVNIIYKADGGMVRGKVDNCTPATRIAVIPEDSTMQGLEYTQEPARCTEDGHFEIRGLRPGRYYAVALEQLNGEFTDSFADMSALVSRATKLDVRANEASLVDLKIISAP
jgi:Carboxypeptidase regulatory-like domain